MSFEPGLSLPSAMRIMALALAMSAAAGCAGRSAPEQPPAVKSPAVKDEHAVIEAEEQAAELAPVVSPLTTAQMHFLGPADTAPEVALASELSALFTQRSEVLRAYLVKVGYGGNSAPGLALAMAVRHSVPDEVLEQVGSAMAGTVGTVTPLDVIEVDTQQERVIAALTNPFFGAPLPQPTTP